MIDVRDPKNIESVKSILRQNKTGEFWQIIELAIDEILTDIQEQLDGKDILKYSAPEYKVMNEILKGRKRDLLKLKELPDTLILELENPDQSEPDMRGYDDISDLNIQN